MSTFGQASSTGTDEERWLAPRVIEVPPEAFASDWLDRPSEPVKIGLRLVPDHDKQVARAEAAKYAAQMHPGDTENAIDCFNDALLRWLIARATCQPHDVREPWFQMAEDTVRYALSTEGVKTLAHEIEVFELETSPLTKPATDDEVADLAALLERGPPWAQMSHAEQRGTRRLLAVVLERFGEALARGAEAPREPVEIPPATSV
jgi:hypothetical protein